MSESLTELRQSLAGPVVGPGDADYDAAPLLQCARRPPSALIARCIGAGDVAAALDFARQHELEVAVWEATTRRGTSATAGS